MFVVGCLSERSFETFSKPPTDETSSERSAVAAIAYPTTSIDRPARPALRLVPNRTKSRRSMRVVYRRRRLVAVALILIVLSLSVIGAVAAVRTAVGAFGGGPLTSPESSIVDARPAAAASYVVRPGDTLWSIAKALHPSGDLRPYVDRLATRMHGQPLQPGQRITLP